MSNTELIKRLAQILLQHTDTVVCAESCTGGAIASAMTSVAGSSAWFDRGFVAYSNNSKTQMLGVPMAVLEADGSVSQACVAEMAKGALTRSEATVAIAVSGVAGPGGGSPDKPVGCVCFAWLHKDGRVKTQKTVFEGDRQCIRQASVQQAICGLIAFLEARQ